MTTAENNANAYDDPSSSTSHEIDKLIKKFSYSIKQQHERYKSKLEENNNNNKNNYYEQQSNKNNFLLNSSEEASLTTTTNNNNNNAFSYLYPSNSSSSSSSSSSDQHDRSIHSSAALYLLSNNNNNNSQVIKNNKSNFNLNSTITNCYISNYNNKKNNNTHNVDTSSSSSDKAIFFDTLKSLFAIFDPDCKGSIDLNELNTLGANKNEILSDVINYLFNKEFKQVETTTTTTNYLSSNNNNNNNKNNHNLNNSSTNNSSNCSSRSSSANSNNIRGGKHSFRINNNKIKPILIDEYYNNNIKANSSETGILTTSSTNNNNNNSRLTFIKNNFKLNINNNNINSRKEIRSPSANQINKKLKHNNKSINCVNTPYYVSFDEFAQAAEIILDKRKLEKLKMYNNNNNSNTKPRPVSNYNLNNEQYSTVVTVQPPPPIQPNRSHVNLINKPIPSTTSMFNPSSNYTTVPIHTSKSGMLNGATLSQAFENVTNFDINNKQINKNITITTAATTPNSNNKLNNVNKSFDTTLLKNANSCDLGNLIDKEQFLLKQGLNDLDSIRHWYSLQLKENKLKQQNTHKLKHQNLFSIDKMLTDLKQLNDLNSTMRHFIMNTNMNANGGGEQADFENLEMDLSTTTTSNSSSSNSQKENFFMNQQTLAAAASAAAAAISTTTSSSPMQSSLPALPTYKDYLDQFDLNKTDSSELDNYLKEKQDRIENLQKEKSLLIRKLFEMKSEAASLGRTIPNTNGRMINYEQSMLPSAVQQQQQQQQQIAPLNYQIKQSQQQQNMAASNIDLTNYNQRGNFQPLKNNFT